MKHVFNNSGFAQVQAAILSLPTGDLLSEMQQMRSNFSQWLDGKFVLTSQQLQQLDSLQPQFRQSIADSVADSWEQRVPVIFDKQQPTAKTQSDEDRSPKDIILDRFRRQSQNVESDEVVEQMEVVVRISYD